MFLKKINKNSAVHKLTFQLYKNHKQVKQKDKSIFCSQNKHFI